MAKTPYMTFRELDDLDAVKAELARLLPNVKSSHRVEAMARGFDLQSYAALRARLPVCLNASAHSWQSWLLQIDEARFQDYLTAKGFRDLPGKALQRACEIVMDRRVAASGFSAPWVRAALESDLPYSFVPPDGLLTKLRRAAGLIIVAGHNGTGKTTLMSTIADYVDSLSDAPTAPTAVKTIPTLDHGTIKQEAAGAWMRQQTGTAPALLAVDQIRSRALVAASLDAVRHGHIVLGTMMAGGVPQALRHLMAGATEAENREMLMGLSVVIYQNLAPSAIKESRLGYVPIREYVMFDQALKTRLLEHPSSIWPNLVTRWLLAGELTGQTKFQSADKAFAGGLISHETRSRIGDTSRYAAHAMGTTVAV
jgi:hypothetical protein